MTSTIRLRTLVVSALVASGLVASALLAGGSVAVAAVPAAGQTAVVVGSALADDAFSAATKAKKKKATKKKAKKKTKKKTVKRVTPKPAVKPAPAAPAPAAPATLSSIEQRVVALTNAQRSANGCGALRVDAALSAAARAHSADMAANNYFSHTGRDGSNFVTRANRAGYSQASAENIAWGYRSADEVVTGWMNSEGHRRNILTCSSVAVGVGIATKADGTPYYTQVFGRA